MLSETDVLSDSDTEVLAEADVDSDTEVLAEVEYEALTL